MFSRYKDCRDVKERKRFLRIHPAAKIESICGYDVLPEIKPAGHDEIFFYPDGFEVVTAEELVANPQRSDERQYRGLLVDEMNRTITAFSYHGVNFGPIMTSTVCDKFENPRISRVLRQR